MVHVLAVDFYHQPEDMPFKIDPTLFRCAALFDMGTRSHIYFGSLAWKQFTMLLQADPTSLPRTDPVITAYASHLARRIRNLQ